MISDREKLFKLSKAGKIECWWRVRKGNGHKSGYGIMKNGDSFFISIGGIDEFYKREMVN